MGLFFAAVLGQAAQAAPVPPVDAFGTKDLLVILANLAVICVVTLWGRSNGQGDKELERIREKIATIENVQREFRQEGEARFHEVQLALFRIEIDVSNIKGLTEPLKEAVRLNIAALVPRSNPLREETNRAIIRWQMGDEVLPEELLEAAEEVIFEAHEDPKLTEAERVSFSLTGASMHGDAISALNERRLREVLGE